MPVFKGIRCLVKTDFGSMQEWGTSQLRGNKIVQCYIESKDSERFRIELAPRLPYDASHWWREDSHDPDEPQSSGYHGRLRKRRHALSVPFPGIATKPPFQLLASVYLDGRSKPERRAIIYLDAEHEHFDHRTGGAVGLGHRWVEGVDGHIHEYSWFFGEVGIDTLLTKLAINTKEKDDDLASALEGTSLQRDDDPEHLQVGRIVVTLSRCIVGDRWNAEDYHAKHFETDEDDVNMADAAHVDHATRLEAGDVVERSVPCVHFRPYQEDEDNFAEFHFFYRNQATLRKYGFPGFPQPSATPVKPVASDTSPDVRRSARLRMVTNIAALPPLSGREASPPPDSQLTTSKDNTANEIPSKAGFNLSSQNKSLSSSNKYAKLFDFDFRNERKDSLSPIEEPERYPPSPPLSPKAHRSIEAREHTVDGNASEASTIVSDSCQIPGQWPITFTNANLHAKRPMKQRPRLHRAQAQQKRKP